MKTAKTKGKDATGNAKANELTNTPTGETLPVESSSPSAKKSRKAAGKKIVRKAGKPKSTGNRKSAPSAKNLPDKLEPSADEIRLRAYFIAENRHRAGVAGDEGGDWIEALRQLQIEAENS